MSLLTRQIFLRKMERGVLQGNFVTDKLGEECAIASATGGYFEFFKEKIIWERLSTIFRDNYLLEIIFYNFSQMTKCHSPA